jgi:hypothetical protein
MWSELTFSWSQSRQRQLSLFVVVIIRNRQLEQSDIYLTETRSWNRNVDCTTLLSGDLECTTLLARAKLTGQKVTISAPIRLLCIRRRSQRHCIPYICYLRAIYLGPSCSHCRESGASWSGTRMHPGSRKLGTEWLWPT